MNIMKLMKQVQETQQKMQHARDEIAKMQVTGESGAGLVKITMNGLNEASKTVIDPSLTTGLSDEDKEVLEDLISAAINDATRKVKAMSEEAMSKMAGDLNLPANLEGFLGG